jgi:hypothetical protein
MRNAIMSKHAAFIIGTPFCGSTLIGNCLNAHPSVFFGGEIDRLDTVPIYHSSAPLAHDDGCRVCRTHHDYDCPVWTREFLATLRGESIVDQYRAILRHAEAPILLDGSKNIEWLNLLHDQGLDVGKSVILTGRTPFAYALSALGAGTDTVISAAVTWRDYYLHVMRSLSGRGIPNMVVRYEDFAFNPAKHGERLCAFLGIDFEPAMMTYWETPSHSIGGNSGAYIRYRSFKTDTPNGTALDVAEAWKPSYFGGRPFGGWVEDRWIYELSDLQIAQIMAVPLLNEVASLLGYDLGWFMHERCRIRAEAKRRSVNLVNPPPMAASETVVETGAAIRGNPAPTAIESIVLP